MGEKCAIRTCGNQSFSVNIADYTILHDPSVARRGKGTPGRSTQRWMRFHRLFSRGNKGALRIPIHSFQSLRRPGCSAKLLCFHIAGGFDPHRPYQPSHCPEWRSYLPRRQKPAIREEPHGWHQRLQSNRLLITPNELPNLALKAITLERLSSDSGVLMC